MDFTLKKYALLLDTLQAHGYQFVTFSEYCTQKTALSDKKIVILRHDIDDKAPNALCIAQIEHARHIAATYYFRVVPQSNNPLIIKQIVQLGHEIGYHYEDLTICGGSTTEAIVHFERQLRYFRQFYPVKTICMHGSPRSAYDNKALWSAYSYADYGIVGEPYFDTDFETVFYLTDTGRCWDGYRVSVRDKIPQQHNVWLQKGWSFHTTDDVIDAIKNDKIPKQLLITTHPQRWTDSLWGGVVEWLKQTVKNSVKRLVISCRKA